MAPSTNVKKAPQGPKQPATVPVHIPPAKLPKTGT